MVSIQKLNFGKKLYFEKTAVKVRSF
jgi:hypothetical protein